STRAFRRVLGRLLQMQLEAVTPPDRIEPLPRLAEGKSECVAIVGDGALEIVDEKLRRERRDARSCVFHDQNDSNADACTASSATTRTGHPGSSCPTPGRCARARTPAM